MTEPEPDSYIQQIVQIFTVSGSIWVVILGIHSVATLLEAYQSDEYDVLNVNFTDNTMLYLNKRNVTAILVREVVDKDERRISPPPEKSRSRA